MTIDNLLQREKAFSLNHRILFILAGLFLTIAAVSPNTAAQPDDSKKWLGSYSFENMAQTSKRRSSYDVTPGVVYDIVIEQSADGKLTATFNENGVQVYQAYQCTVKTSGEKIEFYYEKFTADGPEDSRKFKKGELLFSLAATKVGKQTKYLFQPAAYKITRYDKTKQKQPIYFEKV